MTYESFRIRLQKVANTLSQSESLIADYVLRHEADICDLSISELAIKVPTSTSTITRFCKKLNYRNFNDFKTLLESEQIKKTDSIAAIDKISEFYQEVLIESSKIIQEKEAKKFVHTILKAKKIVVLGIGSSGLTATELSVRLARMGLNAQSITDSYNMIAQSFLLTENDLLIAISNSGETSEIVEAVSIANKNKTKIYAITKHQHSSLTELSEEVFLTSQTFYIPNKKFFNDQLASLFFIDVITHLLLNDEKIYKTYSDTLQILMRNK